MMPYVDQNKRKHLDPIVKQMVEENLMHPDGSLNYVLFKLARSINPGYQSYRNFIAELNETVAEIRRRMLVPYENLKQEQNGDVL
jgi:hypothetical protein